MPDKYVDEDWDSWEVAVDDDDQAAPQAVVKETWAETEKRKALLARLGVPQ